MKVLLVNGSPHKNGCTDTALREVAGALQAEGIDAEIFWIGNEPVGGCIACGGCAKAGKWRPTALSSARRYTTRRPPAI